jgi:hypothetical protein
MEQNGNTETREMTVEQAQAFDYANSAASFQDGLKKAKAKGDRFVQLDTKALMKMASTFNNISDYQLFMYFIDKMGSQSNALVVSQGAVARVLGCCTKTVGRSVKRLQELQYLQVLKIQGNSNCYVMNGDVVWKTGRDKKQYAVFTATVVAEWDDQLPEHYKLWQKNLRPISQKYIEENCLNKDLDKEVEVVLLKDNNNPTG